MMKVLDAWYLLFGCISFFATGSGESGFILTSPKVLDVGSTEHFILTVFDVPLNGTAVLSLHSKEYRSIIARSAVITSNGSTTISMKIPPTKQSEAWLEISGSFLGDRVTSIKKRVSIRDKSVITFVQTDKPIYKPGQTVRIRVFPLNSQLRPLKNAHGRVWIEDPGSLRIAQWKNVNFSLGIVQFDMPLSEEPVLGVWTIKTKIAGITDSQVFSVEEYVLPKYEVRIKAPKYFSKTQNGSDLPIEVCAHYTYGKKVDGLLNVTVALKGHIFARKNEDFQPLVLDEKISGCHTFHVKRDQILTEPDIRLSDSILVFAQVIENGTGVTQNASAVIQEAKPGLKIKFLSFGKGYQYFKPGLPLHETLRVSKADGTPATFKDINVCYTLKNVKFSMPEVCQNYRTNEKGEVGFSISGPSSVYNEMELEARAMTGRDVIYPNSEIHLSSEKVSLKAWFSSSGSHLQIQPIFQKVPCRELQQIEIRYTTNNSSTINFYYQVMSRGRIVKQDSYSHTAIFSDHLQEEEIPVDSDDNRPEVRNGRLPPYIGEFNLTLPASASISPTARLLVFYVRPDGEIVSDSRVFHIDHCLLNEANLGFRTERQYPSTEAELHLSASPFSHCGVGFVDKSVHIMKPEKQINKEKVFTVMEKYDLSGSTQPIQTTQHHCRSSEYRYISDNPDALGTAISDDDDSIVGSTRLRWHRPGRRDRFRSYMVDSYADRHVDSITAFENAGLVIITSYDVETRPCYKKTTRKDFPFPDYDNLYFYQRRGNIQLSSLNGDMVVGMALPIPREKPVNKESKETKVLQSVAEIRSYFPETWLWELHSTGETGETVFNKTLPDTVTEWMGSAICVHPMAGLGISDVARITAFQPFFISFTLPFSVIREEVVPVIITVFNYLTECLPIKLSLEPKEEYVIVRESRIHKLCVCGGESKSHRFYIRPVTLGRVNITVYGYSLEDDTICGNETTKKFTARDAVTRQLLVEAEGFPKEEVFNSFVCPSESNGTFSTEVDLLLPTNVVQGSARAYFKIVGDFMAPGLDNLDRLVKLPTGCGEQNMIRFVPNIFVLDYLISSGKVIEEIKTKTMNHMKTGYQRELRYRHKDGSYSAFGESDNEGSLWLTAFVVRSFSHARRFITIDKKDLTHSTTWIVKQQLANGCFRRVGTVFSSGMKGGLSRGGDSLAPLTAYVLIALLEAENNSMEVVTKGMECLQSDTNPTVYSLALYAYASALAKDPKAQVYLKQLESRAIKEGNEMHWKYSSESSRSVDIEIGAYAILAMLEAGGINNIPKATPIVRWITKQRNSNGGFVSTQDTVMALQSLAKYASFTSEDQVNIDAVVKSDELLRTFKVDESNNLMTQSVKIPVVPTIVDFEASGVGCALAQFTLRYNVQFSTGSEAFDLNVTTSENGNNGCYEPQIGICMRYKIPRQTSNMVVATVKMVSGYIPDKTSIKKLYDDNALALKRHDIDGSDIHFYFSELTNEQKCFRFLVKNEFTVEDVKPAIVKLYDYYQTEWQITKDYEIPHACLSSVQP